ncbi:MAG: bifunctional adenosylcobinamide kinase/adenosylcobinamide-phosphate guanylyltransferase [bacterium]|nr:bifunctional adenosylcobinamide kinase/adenosylcobinamide-phosphate guanylyltransferase [bacterium]
MGRMILITGGSGSGKSEYAEKRLSERLEKRKFYVATMMVYGKEGEERVKKHRSMRAGKGFETIEQTTELGCIVGRLRQAEEKGGAAVLLECLSNWVANELFAQEDLWREEEKVLQLEERMLQELWDIREHSAALIVVTNEIFSDGISYDASTLRYQKLLGDMNRKLAQKADEIIEVMYGILCMKKSKNRV